MLLFNIPLSWLLSLYLAIFSLQKAQELPAAAATSQFPSASVSLSWHHQAVVPGSGKSLEIAKPASEKLGLVSLLRIIWR